MHSEVSCYDVQQIAQRHGRSSGETSGQGQIFIRQRGDELVKTQAGFGPRIAHIRQRTTRPQRNLLDIEAVEIKINGGCWRRIAGFDSAIILFGEIEQALAGRCQMRQNHKCRPIVVTNRLV